MKPVRFRVWDTTENKWGDGQVIWVNLTPSGEIVYGEYEGGVEENEGRFEISFFTGLYDKNNKEIFEGDCVKDSTGVCLVAWNDQLASFCLRRNGWAFDHFFGEAVDPKDVEVIGSVYENTTIK